MHRLNGKTRRTMFGLLVLVWVVCCLWAAPLFAGTVYPTANGWCTSTPEAQGIKSGMLADMMEKIDTGGFPIQSITVIRHGSMVLDAYFFPFEKGEKHIIHSCTKSIMSALVGIAIDKGYIKGVSQPMLDFFPDKRVANIDDRKKAITLENLLTMASGLRCRDSYLYRWKGLMEMVNTADWAQYMLDLPMAEAPGQRFEYCNGVSYLLSVIVQNTTGMRTLDFARKYLFGPLAITDIKWMVSPQNVDVGWGEMWLKPHDMAKIGWLYLNKGRWEGKQIVPKKWVEASTRGHIDSTLFPHYGYQWWVDTFYYMAVGYKGQFIYVIPGKDMVVVFTGALGPDDFYKPKQMLDKYIIPAAASSTPLPVDSKSNTRLRALVTKCAQGPPQGVIWTTKEEGAAKDGVFYRTASPAFTFEYPKGSTKRPLEIPDQIMTMETPDGVIFQASVAAIPPGLKLADVGPKALAAAYRNVGSDVQVISNKEITLKDGTTAYKTRINWLFQGSFPLKTLAVSAFRGGKWVFLTAHPWKNPEEVAPLVESLTFKK